MRRWGLLGLLLPLLSSPASAEEAWDWSEKVAYKENHDPGLLVLEDGRELQVLYRDIAWEEVDKWSAGRPLLLAYRAATGAVLQDPQLGKGISVLGGLEAHPIDALLDQCMQSSETTLAMNGCNNKALERWDAEVNRVYQALLAGLEGEAKQKLQEAQQAWVKFWQAQLLAIAAIYTDGSHASVTGGGAVVDVTRDQALRLTAMLAR